MLPGHKLSEVELPYLYHVLDDEVKRARIGRPARASFRLLEGVSYLLPFVLSLAYLLNSLGPRLGPEMQTLIDDATAWLGGLILPVLVAIVALFVANLPLLMKVYRQWRLSRRLIALRLLDYAMLPPPRLQLKLLVLFAPIGLLMLFLHNVFAAPAESVRQRVAAALILLVFWPVALFLADRLLRRLRGRLQYFEEVRAVRTELATAGGSGGEPVLSQGLLTRLADIERARLLQGRAEAAGQRLFESETSYAVRKSDSALATLRGLDASERVQLETGLENLASRQAGGMEISKAGPPATFHVEGTPWQLVYEIETVTRTIHVIAIRAQKDYS